MATATLHLGDCLDVLPTMEAGSVHALVTDPPYMLGSASTRTSSRSSSLVSSLADWSNASIIFAEWARQCWRVLRDDGSLWWHCNWRSLPVVTLGFERAGIKISSAIIWDKEWIGVGGHKNLREQFEMLVMARKPGFGIEDRSLSNVWRVKWGSHRATGHPSEKPTALYRHLFKVADLKPGSTVLDPFAGSGTTLVAAVEFGLEAIGVELDPEYHAIASRRLAEVRRVTPLFAGTA